MPDPTPILQYANLTGQRPRPTKHPGTVSISLSLYILAVFIYAMVELYGWMRWTYEEPSRLAEHVIDAYMIIPIICLTIFLSICFAIAALCQPFRKKWAAIVALLLSLSAGFTFGIV